MTLGANMENAEESALLGARGSDISSNNSSDNNSELTGVQVRRRLGVCLFLYLVGLAVITQVYPKVILEYFDNDDGRASKFTGWLTFASCVVQLIAVPSLSGASDAIGRRAVLGGSLALQGLAVLALGGSPNSVVAVSACQIVSGMCGAFLPVSQAIIVDVSHWGEAGGGGEVTHGLGLIGAAFGLAITVGPVVGGSLSEFHRSTACILCATMSLLSLLSLRFYGWKETAPEQRAHGAATDASRRTREGRECCGRWSTWRFVNPFSILKVFFESRLMLQLALCLLYFSLALNAIDVYYNYLDYRYHWSAVDISFYFSAVGVVLALTSGLVIRFLVPKHLSEGQGVRLGMFLQASGSTLGGLAPRGWMLYPVLLATAVQHITEPCIQAIMAKLVGNDRQGSLQGAVMSLRIVATGMVAPVYGQVFSLGVSDSMEKALGVRVPGLPLFLSAQCSLSGLILAWCALRKLDTGRGPAEEPRIADGVDVAEECRDVVAPRSTEERASVATVDTSTFRMGRIPSIGTEENTTSGMLEPLLTGSAPN